MGYALLLGMKYRADQEKGEEYRSKGVIHLLLTLPLGFLKCMHFTT